MVEAQGITVMNLMNNGIDAVKVVDGPRELGIKSQRADQEILVCVSDNGVGLPASPPDEIFYAFFTTIGSVGAIRPGCPAEPSPTRARPCRSFP